MTATSTAGAAAKRGGNTRARPLLAAALFAALAAVAVDAAPGRGGFEIKHSTDVESTTEPSPRTCTRMSIQPEARSCGHIRSRFDCFSRCPSCGGPRPARYSYTTNMETTEEA